MSDTLSVIVRTSPDRSAFLDQCLFSLSCQAYRPVELVLVVHESAPDVDRSAMDAALERHCWAFAAVRRVPDTGSGDAAARGANLGLQAATGRFVSFMDDGDVVYRSHYRDLVDALVKSGRSWARSDVITAEYAPEPDGGAHLVNRRPLFERRGESFAEQLHRHRVPLHAFVFDRRAMPDLPAFRDSPVGLADYQFLLNIPARHIPVHVPEASCEQRVRRDRPSGAEQPLVSVIVRSMDRPCLDEALDSVARQTYPNIEVVLVNAKGPEHADKGERCGPFPMRLVGTGERLPRARAANVGLDAARGDYLVFLDDDDLFEPEHLEKLAARLGSKPSPIVAYTGVVCRDASGAAGDTVFETPFDPVRLIGGNFIPIHAALFDRGLVEQGCRFDEELDVYEDWDFWLQLAERGPFAFVPGVSAIYRAEGTSGIGVQSKAEATAAGRRRVIEKWRARWPAACLEEALARSTALEHKDRQIHEIAHFADQQAQSVRELKGIISALHAAHAADLAEARATEAALRRQLDEVAHLAHVRGADLQMVYASRSWRVTAPLRAVGLFGRRVKVVLRAVRAVARLPGGPAGYTRKALAIWKREGAPGVKLRILRLAGLAPPVGTAGLADNREALLRRFADPDAETLERMQREIEGWGVRPRVSIVVPVYNTPPEHLVAMIHSVQAQVYPDWELCLADDASPSAAVRPALERFSRADDRIRVVFRERNGGISAASNDALALCTGEYIALLDHDDELTPDALYWVIKEAAAHPEADVFYTDEDKLAPDGSRTELFVKPDWSPELMFNCMYIGHLTVYKKALLDRVGGFRSEFDFSQDYDLALRATEVAREVRHIPRILYHWRQAEGSAARGDKPYARESNVAALQSALDRRGLPAKAIALPTANRARFSAPRPSVSIIVPTDSEENLRACLDALADKTDFAGVDIVAVTNSGLADKLGPDYRHLPLSFCRYDKPYNFSDKCNAGAAQAAGDIVLFLNDDVRPLARGWLEDTVEFLVDPEVGAVAPKLLYENGTIQHAGMVTGVRGLVGTAFHCLPADTGDHFNFAQSVRDVSILSGACFAMRRKDFLAVGGYDAVNAPIGHSDVDLSFKVREKGLRCVYTPHAELLHIGHLSLREHKKKPAKKRKDKSHLFLLKRWGAYVAYDPYYPDNMRDLLFRDSPEPYRLTAHNRPDWVSATPDVLLVSHDLSASGAPMVVYYAAKQLLESGAFPVVAAPEDGPLRSRFEALGIPVIVDSLLLTRHESVRQFASHFDCILANTMVSWPIVHQMADEDVPVLWYVHECKPIEEWAQNNPLFAETLRKARHLYAGSNRSLAFCRPYNPEAKVLTYGVADTSREEPARVAGPLVFSLFGSVEPRKGQDIFVEAARRLEKRVNGAAVFQLVGRVLDSGWAAGVEESARALSSVRFTGPVDQDQYLEMMAASDVIVVPSRDDTLPLVSLDALCQGKALILSDAVGTSDFLTHRRDAVIVPSESAQALADAMAEFVENRARVEEVGRQARQSFLKHFSEAAFGQELNRIVGEAIATGSGAASTTPSPRSAVAEGELQ